MNQEYLLQTNEEIISIKQTRDAYKKQFWLRAKSLDATERKTIKKLFAKIDRLRNHLSLWLKQLMNGKHVSHDNYQQLIERGKTEIQQSFVLLDQALYKP